MMSKFNHAYSLNFTVISDDPEGEDVTDEMFRDALKARLEALTEAGQLADACERYDTFEEGE